MFSRTLKNRILPTIYFFANIKYCIIAYISFFFFILKQTKNKKERHRTPTYHYCTKIQLILSFTLNVLLQILRQNVRKFWTKWRKNKVLFCILKSLCNLKVIWQLWLINLNISFVVVITLKFQSKMKTVKKFCGAFPLSKKVLFFVCEENLDRNEKWYNFSLFSHCSKTFYFL